MHFLAHQFFEILVVQPHRSDFRLEFIGNNCKKRVRIHHFITCNNTVEQKIQKFIEHVLTFKSLKLNPMNECSLELLI